MATATRDPVVMQFDVEAVRLDSRNDLMRVSEVSAVSLKLWESEGTLKRSLGEGWNIRDAVVAMACFLLSMHRRKRLHGKAARLIYNTDLRGLMESSGDDVLLLVEGESLRIWSRGERLPDQMHGIEFISLTELWNRAAFNMAALMAGTDGE